MLCASRRRTPHPQWRLLSPCGRRRRVPDEVHRHCLAISRRGITRCCSRLPHNPPSGSIRSAVLFWCGLIPQARVCLSRWFLIVMPNPFVFQDGEASAFANLVAHSILTACPDEGRVLPPPFIVIPSRRASCAPDDFSEPLFSRRPVCVPDGFAGQGICFRRSGDIGLFPRGHLRSTLHCSPHLTAEWRPVDGR